MTAEEWIKARDSRVLLRILGEAASPRRMRLFACACCRRIWVHFPDPKNQLLVEAVENHPTGRFEDPDIRSAAGASSSVEWVHRDKVAYWVAKYLGRGFYKLTAFGSAMIVVTKILLVVGDLTPHPSENELEQGFSNWAVSETPLSLCHFGTLVEREGHHQADLLRDIFPNPYRSVPAFEEEWRHWNDGLVLNLARAAAADRELPSGVLNPERMAILADALEDAGCADAEILGHLHSPWPHVRGCWVLDWIFGVE